MGENTVFGEILNLLNFESFYILVEQLMLDRYLLFSLTFTSDIRIMTLLFNIKTLLLF